MPLWGNPMLPHLYNLPNPFAWAGRGITTMKHIIKNERRMSFPDLRALYSLPRSWEFCYW